MGLFRHFGDARPVRRFVLGVEPSVAMGLAVEYLKAAGFVDHEWDLQSALSSGAVESGWSGTLMAKGSHAQGIAAGCLVDILPVLNVFSFFRSIHEPLRVAIYARPDSDPRSCELILFYPHDDSQSFRSWDQKDDLIAVFEAFAKVAYQAQVYVVGPERLDQRDLANEHPASYVAWIKIEKVMKRAARRDSGWGF